MCGPLPFLSEEAEFKMTNAVVAMLLHKSCVTLHGVIAVANSTQKGTPTENRFKNESVL